MDETLAVVALDLADGRHWFIRIALKVRVVGDLQTELVHDFFDGFVNKPARTCM